MKYALIKDKDTMVKNIIVGDDNTKYKGYFLVPFQDDNFCQPGMYYNSKDGKFYFQKDFSS